jgi:hypothetical protein
MKPLVKVLLIGCGSLAFLGLALVVGLGVWLFSGPESGVKLGNEMDLYALDYLSEHEILEPGEEILAYYDATMSMDGTEAAILTSERVLYHKAGRTASIPIQEIEDIRHRKEPLVGDVIEVQAVSGEVMKIEIAPLNLGETFLNVLKTTWKNAPSEVAEAESGD